MQDLRDQSAPIDRRRENSSTSFEWLPCCCALTLIGMWHASTITLGLGYYDEGLAVVGAERLLQGEIPYRDFWSLYAPGNFVFVAGVFKVFGFQLLATRLASLAMYLVGLGMLFAVARRMLRLWSAAALIVGVGMVAHMPWGVPTTLAMTPAIACILATMRWWERGGLANAFGAGLMAGMTGFVRHDFGTYVAVTAVLFAIVEWAVDSVDGGSLGRFLAWFAVGLACVVAPLAVAASIMGIWSEVAADLIEFPARVYPEVRAIPWPSFMGRSRATNLTAYGQELANRFLFNLAPVLPAIALATYGLMRWKRPLKTAESTRWPADGLCAFAASMFLLQARIRPDHGHLVPSLMFSLPAFAGAIAAMRSGLLRFVLSMPVWLAALAGQSIEKADEFERRWLSSNRVECGLPRAWGIYVDKDKDVAVHAIQFVRSSTTPTEQPFIYVGNTRHDRILASSTLFYFLAERRCPNRHHEMHPGLTTTSAVQREIVESLKSRNVQTVVRYDESAAEQEPNASATSSGVTELDDFLKANYRRDKEFGCYHMWRRR